MIIAAFFLLVVLRAQLFLAQTPFEGGISVGAVASQVDGDGFSGYNKSALMAGIWVSKSINQRHSFQLEINFVPKGSRSSVKNNAEDVSYYKLSLRYFEIPIFYKYDMKQIILSLGLAPNYLFYDHQEGYFSQVAQYQNNTGFNRFDFCGVIGVIIPLNNNWRIGTRFSYSLYDAAKKYIAPDEIIYNKQYNNCLMFAVYRNFRHK